MSIGAPRQYGTPQASPSPVALGPVTRSDFFEKARNSVISLIGIIAVVPAMQARHHLFGTLWHPQRSAARICVS